MKLKTVLAAALLLFVAASIAAPMVRHVIAARRRSFLDVAAAAVAPARPDALVVYDFRANVRCTACRTLEACSHEVVAQRFSAEAADGRIEWHAIDYQTPGNEHWLSDYQLLTGGIVLVQFRDGRPERWTALTETWNMTADRASLSRYLEDCIREFSSGVGFSPPSHADRPKPILQSPPFPTPDQEQRP